MTYVTDTKGRCQFTIVVVLLAAILQPFMATTAPAQSDFSAVAQIGDRVVTQYEVNQRVVLLQVLGTGGDLEKAALDRLVDERLQAIAVERAGISTTDAQIDAGIEEFAAQGKLTGAQLLTQLADAGVDERSLRDFIRVGLAWRTLVRQRFAALSAPTEAEIDRELGLAGRRPTLEFQFSEIFLPTNTANNAAITADLAPQIAALTRTDQFEDAARRFSAAQSAPNGGRIPDWVPISSLPPALRDVLPAMAPGEVTAPIEFNNAVGLFQLRAKREAVIAGKGAGSIDYASVRVAADGRGSAAEAAAALRARVDTCDDLYGELTGPARTALQRQTMPTGRIPADLAHELAALDPGEVSTRLSPDGGQTVTFLMLCARLPGAAADSSGGVRDDTRQTLLNRNLTAFAEGYLQELRGEIRITMK